nr:hypothetical protein [Tanacetum cinerariifolium]
MGRLNGPLVVRTKMDSAMKENYQDEALKQKAMNERSWGDATQEWKMNDHECSSFTNWRNHIHETYVNTNINANYNHYLDVLITLDNHAGRNDDETIQEERKLNDGHGIGNFDNDLVRDNAPYHANEEEKHFEEDRCEMLRNPYQELLVHLKTSRAQKDKNTSVILIGRQVRRKERIKDENAKTLRRRNRRVQLEQRNEQPEQPKVVYALILDINYFRHFLDILENYNPMDDEPMWAIDRVVALTPGFVITIPETANEFAIKGNRKELKSDMSYLEESVRHIEDYLKILKDIERGLYSKKPPIRRIDLNQYSVSTNFQRL